MDSITIRQLEPGVKARLRVRAAEHGRSMEQEAREILKAGLSREPAAQLNLVAAIRRHIEPLGGVDLKLPKREAARRPPKFE